MYQTQTENNIKNNIFQDFPLRVFAIVITTCQFDHRIF